jgi:hypothetical protein
VDEVQTSPPWLMTLEVPIVTFGDSAFSTGLRAEGVEQGEASEVKSSRKGSFRAEESTMKSIAQSEDISRVAGQKLRQA